MDPLLGHSETHLAKRVWEQLNTPPATVHSDLNPKRRCTENPWMTPGISPSSNQLGNNNWPLTADDGGNPHESLQPIGEVESMFSTGFLESAWRDTPLLNPVEQSTTLWPPLPATGDHEHALFTPNSEYNDSCLQIEQTATPTVSINEDLQLSQTTSNRSYDVCFGMVSRLSVF